MTEQEFYQIVPEWVQHDIARWNHITLLAYFCYCYKQKYHVEFKLVRNKKSGPTNGKESRDMARLFSVMAPENYNDLSSEVKDKIRTEVILKVKNYINWMFQVKFRSGERSITGTQIFLLPNMLNEFEVVYKKWIDKNSKQDTFKQLLDWCKENISMIFNQQQLERSEDLKMIKRYAITHQLEADSLEMRLLKKAEEMKLI